LATIGCAKVPLQPGDSIDTFRVLGSDLNHMSKHYFCGTTRPRKWSETGIREALGGCARITVRITAFNFENSAGKAWKRRT
jgi:hypothetical protein